MSGLTGVWDQLVDAVCRPPRDDSYTDEDLVGGQRASFRLGKARYYRQDLEVGVCQRAGGEHARPVAQPPWPGPVVLDACIVYTAFRFVQRLIACHLHLHFQEDPCTDTRLKLPRQITSLPDPPPQLHNERGERLLCSHFRPCIVASKDGRLPVVVYCHCNSGSRRDAEEIIYHFLPRHVTVFSLDFSVRWVGDTLSVGCILGLGYRRGGGCRGNKEHLPA